MSTMTVDIDSPLYSDARTDPKVFVPHRIWENSSWTKSLLPEEPSENATGLHDRPPELAESFRYLLMSAKYELFEDGIESEFSKGLMALIKKYENDALAELAYFIVYEKVSTEVAAEALRWLGLMDHLLSYHWRLWLLERSLNSRSARIRDGAVLGLSFLDDPDAIPYLRQAVDREPVKELRADMEQVIVQLESGLQCHSS
jgi:HEAT repeat protein